MKTFKPLLLSAFLLINLAAASQNSTPVISHFTALADTVFHKLTLTFDLDDAENDNMEIFLSISADSGVSYVYNTSNATGDVGYPVAKGNNKRLEWYYPDSLSAMLTYLSVKLTAYDRVGIDIQQIVDQIDTNRLKQNLQFIEGRRHRTTGQVHLQEVRDSLFEIFQRNGLQARVHDVPFNLGYTGKNIVGRKPGVASEKRTFIVDGHYDTVNDSPGADDNGSAIAGMLEILRVISPINCRNTVEFIGFDLEEDGLAGSKAYVQNGIQPYEGIAGVFNADMIGYYSSQPNSQTVPAGFNIVFPALYARLVADSFRGNFIISTANANSQALLNLFDSMAVRYVPDLLVGSIRVPGNGEAIPDSRRSDHAAFRDSGFVALHISDGAETRNPNYHDPTDVSSTISYTFMSNVTKAIAATLLDQAGPLHADVEVSPVTADPRSNIWQLQEGGCKLILSPNPSDGHFKISNENCNDESIKCRIFSIEGKLIWQSVLQPRKEIDLNQSISAGHYMIEMGTSQKTLVKKIFIK